MRSIGLDIGGRRIGAAVSDPERTTAFPLIVIDRADDDKAVSDIVKLVDEYEASEIIYGLPLEMDATAGRQAADTEAFAERIRQAAGIPVKSHDERLSTAEAERRLLEQDVSRKKRHQVVDKVAAAIILQAYLDGVNGREKS